MEEFRLTTFPSTGDRRISEASTLYLIPKRLGKNSLGWAPEDRNECEKLKYRERRKTLARQKRLERPPLSAEELAAASQGAGGWMMAFFRMRQR